MTDTRSRLFALDRAGEWVLEHDSQCWIVSRRFEGDRIPRPRGRWLGERAGSRAAR